MKLYELTVLLTPNLGEKELDKALKALQTLLEKANAKIKNKTDAVKKPLAYELGKNQEAFYAFWELELDPSRTAEVEGKLKVEENVIRYLLVKKG